LPKLVLTEDLRNSLKKPLGKLLQGSGHQVYDQLAETIFMKNPPCVVFVGDSVSQKAHSRAIRRDVMIVDSRERRGKTKPLQVVKTRTFRVRNDPGTISSEAWAAVEEAVESGDAIMIVDGEEDLLTLVAMAVSPLGSFVIYGQPNEGLVIVEVDDAARKMAWCFLEAMTKTA
jgi:uncharacterized protein (UPF0218 family)